MKKSIIILLPIVLSCCFYSCWKDKFEDGKHSYFIFENKSNLGIVVYDNNDRYTPDSGYCYGYNYRSVSKSQINANKNRMVVYANSTNDRLLNRGPHTIWEGIINSCNYDTLKLFILDYTRVLSVKPIPPNYNGYPDFVPFDSVFVQRYDLTIKDLDCLGWLLSYPPNERMKDVKMYPPYKE